MATITYEDVIPSIIPNTTMIRGLVDGVHRNYRITPNEGYVLHNKFRDYEDADGNAHLGYTKITISCAANYDFSPVTVTDEYGGTFIGYGVNEYAARPESDVPANQIFGVGGNNNHETA